VSGLPDLRDFVRAEPAPRDETVLVRGGPDTLAKLTAHAGRFRRRFVLDGEPVLGISVFAALDDIGPASLDGILSSKLATYRSVHLVALRALVGRLHHPPDLPPTPHDCGAEFTRPDRAAAGRAWTNTQQPALW
jgi:hypothetical protein